MGVIEFLGLQGGKNYDKLSFWFLSLTIIGFGVGVLYEAIYLQTETNNILMGIGSFLFIAGIVIRLISSYTLGKQFTIRVVEVKEHELIKEGIYSVVRHPIYSAGILNALGVIIFFNSFFGVLLLFPLMLAGYYRIKVEEDFLLKKFGRSYENYMLRVKGLIPYIW